MAITIAQIIAVKGPSFVGDSRLDAFEELACLYVSDRAFVDKTNLAKSLVMLHWLTLEAQGGGDSSTSGSGSVGGIKKEQEGKLIREIHSTISEEDSDNYWKSTSFGSEYLILRKACIFKARTRCVVGV